jgi:alkylation response protein AidB-like acyl-CoA dehydrogenase
MLPAVQAIDSVRGEVREFLRQELRAGTFEPRCDAWLSGFDAGFSRKLGDHGWVGMTLPKEYGGGGASPRMRYAVIEELLAAGAPVAAHWIADRQTGPLLVRYGTEEQKRRFLPAIARGEPVFAIGLSEPDSGSDLASLRTAARPAKGGWLVTGSKVWTSGGHRVPYMLTLVRSTPNLEDRHAGLSQLIVDLRTPGVEVRPIALLSGEKHFNEVVLKEVFVPYEMLVGREGDGWRQVTAELAYERSGPERILSTFPLLAELVLELGPTPNERAAAAVGELVARLSSLRRLSLGIAARLERGEYPVAEAALVKDTGTKFERDVIEMARLVRSPEEGGERYRRLYWDAVLAAPGFTLRGGTSEILRGIVARSLKATGGPALLIDDEVLRLVARTAASVFGREAADPWSEVEKAGLLGDEVSDLTTAATVVAVSAYYAADIPYAERVMLPDPGDRVRGALMRSVQMAGGIARVRDMAIDYAADRHQFGQAINRFQAVQRLLAELAAEAACAEAAAAAAVANPSFEGVAAAKIVTGRAAGRAAGLAHQIHGAIGFTHEHPLHRLTTKLWRWRDEYGTESHWAVELGRSVAGRDVWELLTA